jgi:hypothetical protein
MQAPTVLHGVAESVANYSKLPGKGNMASECLTEDVLSKHVFDDGQRAWLPMEYIAFYYDVGEHGGGTVTTYDLGVDIPAGTIIIGGILIVADKFVAATGTPLLSIGTDLDSTVFLSGSNICAASVNDKIATVPLFANAATWNVPATDTHVAAYITDAGLTAGRLYGYLMCFRNVIGGENSSSSSSSSSSSTGVSSSSSSSRLYSSSSPSSTSS